MKKRIFMILALAAMSISGCARSEINMHAALERALKEAEEVTVPPASYQKEFYAYYAQPCIGRISATRTGNVFAYEGQFFVMNLDVPTILREDSTELTALAFSGGTEEASASGTFTDRQGNPHPYQVRISTLGERHFVCLQTDTMQFYGVCLINSAPLMAGEMLKIGRSVTIEKNAIAAYFKSSSGIYYTGETIELFDSITPENGSIEELFPDTIEPDDFNKTDKNSSDQSEKK
ncbi:MAG: hypothetical protein IKG53_09795 [Solobacterium sp.]|nr:hypothetical protein [Solobacterium sp.]